MTYKDKLKLMVV